MSHRHTCLQNANRRPHPFTQHSTLVRAATDMSAVCMLDCKMRAGRDRLHSSVLTVLHCLYRIPCRSSGFILLVLYPLPQWLHFNTVLACPPFSFQHASIALTHRVQSAQFGFRRTSEETGGCMLNFQAPQCHLGARLSSRSTRHGEQGCSPPPH